jgi:beige protein homolog 1
MEALTSLVKCNVTAEVFRSLALFVTYAYHKPSSSGSGTRTPKNQGGTLPIRSALNSNGPRRPTLSTFLDGKEMGSANLTKRQLGNKVLEMYSDILCEKGNTSNIRKFARTVTNKVCLPSVVALPAFANLLR